MRKERFGGNDLVSSLYYGQDSSPRGNEWHHNWHHWSKTTCKVEVIHMSHLGDLLSLWNTECGGAYTESDACETIDIHHKRNCKSLK